MAIEDKYNRALLTKAELKNVLNKYGGEITDETVFREYPVIAQRLLESGGGGGGGVLQEKTITENGVYTPDEGFDGFSKVAVNVESGASGDLPTLFTPSISFNSGNTILSISDDKNGAFVEGYNLYANDNYIVTLTNKSEKLSDYIDHTETLTLKVNAKGNRFNNSDWSNSVTWIYIDIGEGTVGLSYTLSGTYYYCNGIGTATDTDIEISNEVEGLPVLGVGTEAFKDNANITSVIIPPNVSRINYYAFQNCSSLKTLTINSLSISLGLWCCSGCTSLEEIRFNVDKISALETSSFANCINLKKVCIPSINVWLDTQKDDTGSGILSYAELYAAGELVTDIEFPNTLKQIKRNIFKGYKHLNSITIPNTITAIAKNAFEWCSNLKTITFEKNSTLQQIYQGAFANCKSLTSFTIPKTVTTVESEVFRYCDNLESVIFEEGSSLTEIGSVMFGSCPKLTSIIIPDTVTNIYSEAFASTGLVNITIPDTVTYIGQGAFASCTSLVNINMGVGVSIIRKSFDGCKNLKRIDCSKYTSIPTLQSADIFYGDTFKYLQIKVPANLIDEWKNATNWSTYADKIVTEFTNTL